MDEAEDTITPAPALDKPAPAQRLDFIDLLRGLVIVLMVLDHTRDFMHKQAFAFDPLDLDKTTPLLFFIRWITHLCAPTFTFLAGVSIFLQATKGKTGLRLSGFLLTRGLWLVVLELTLIGFGWNFAEPFVFLQIIWAIGVSMILMAGLTLLPGRSVLIIGLLITASHGLLATVHADALGGAGQVFWRLFMEPGGLGAVPGFILYPVLPWLGIMCLGYGVGPIFLMEDLSRKRALEILLVVLIGLFLILRLPNLYGDPNAWAWQHNPLLSALDVLKVSKYPPSLDYTLITLGVSLFLGLCLQRLPALLKAPLLAFGRTPLLTYIVHIYIVHTVAMLIGVAQGIPADDFANFLGDPQRLIKAGWGLSLWQVLLIWVLILAALYPISRAYAAYRVRHNYWWHSYV